MKLELSNVHYSKQLSRETNAFTAILFVDGKPFARVRNDGNGGAHFYDPVTPGSGASREQIAALTACCQAQLETEHDAMASIEPLDQICDRLLEESLQQKTMAAKAKRAVKRNVIMFRTPDDLKHPGYYHELKFKVAMPEDQMRAHVRNRHPEAVFPADVKGDPSIDLPEVAEVAA